MNYDKKYMCRALQLARNGEIFASPNPMVGAVIVHNDTIIGEGFHRRYGEGHAEVNAVASVTQPELLPHSTIYVTLEPCSHYGKTPPCAQLIIDKKIPRVVIGCLDPFEKVSGRGVKMLQEAGIEVVHGVLEDECRQLNTKFIIAHTLHRPFITLKWAKSKDGFIDHFRSAVTPYAARFSTTETSALTHKLRATHDAIMVGSNTVINDNPSLNCRLWDGNNPMRVTLDRRGKIPATATIFNQNQELTLYFTQNKRNDISTNIEQIIIKKDSPLSDILNTLYKRGITSLLIEGGATLLQNAINDNLWDIARIETAPIILAGNGSIKAPTIDKNSYHSTIIGQNNIEYIKNETLNII